MNNEKYLKIIEILAEAISQRDLDISILKIQNDNLKQTIKELELKLELSCEENNKESEVA